MKRSGATTIFSVNDLLMLLVIQCWGLTFLFTKLGLQSLDPLSFANLRIASAVIVLAVIAAFHAGSHGTVRLHFSEHLLAMLLGVLGMACFPFCFSLAMNHTSAANAGLIFGTTPVVVAAMSRMFGMERFGLRQWAGLILSFTGVACIMFAKGIQVSPAAMGGDLLMVLAMLIWAVYTVINRFVKQSHSSLQITAYGGIWGAAALAAASFGHLAAVSISEVSPVSWLGGLCAGVLGTALSYVIWNSSIKSAGPAKTAVYLNLVPIVAAVSGFLILNEALGWPHLAAAVFVVTGVMLTRAGPDAVS
ncbi:MAG: DMT family transporter [Thermodesulfobacteriota bacterium]